MSTQLGPEPEICKYEQLRERPGPFYIEPDSNREAPAMGQRSWRRRPRGRRRSAAPLRGTVTLL